MKMPRTDSLLAALLLVATGSPNDTVTGSTAAQAGSANTAEQHAERVLALHTKPQGRKVPWG